MIKCEYIQTIEKKYVAVQTEKILFQEDSEDDDDRFHEALQGCKKILDNMKVCAHLTLVCNIWH